MKILFITNYFPPHEVGGYGQLCRDVAVRLEARGHAVAIVTSDYGVGSAPPADGIHRLLRIQPRYGAPLSPVAQFWLQRRRIEKRNRRLCRAVVDAFGPDVAFIWNLEGLPHELAIDTEATPGLAVAYWLASASPAEPDAFWRYWIHPPGRRTFLAGAKDLAGQLALAEMRREGKPVRPRMQHVAVVSQHMRRTGLGDGTLPEHTEVIYNGVETASFYRPVPPSDAMPPTNILLAGRISPDKGVHVALRALGIVAKARPRDDFRLLVAGGGPPEYLQHLRQLVASEGIDHLVSFLGRLPREQMPELMHRCHILLLPTVHQEPFARVVLEAMAAGLTVVGTLTGGTGELLQDGVNGLTSGIGDGADLARQIRRLLDDPVLRHQLASRGQEVVMEVYTLEHMVDRVEDFLVRAVAEQIT